MALRSSASFGRLVIAAALSFITYSASAAMVGLSPSNATTSPGGTLTFDVIANFGNQATTGGATDLGWNAGVLQFESFSFNSSLAPPICDSFFDVLDHQSPGLLSLGFGNFSGIALPTDTIIGTLSFLAIGQAGSATMLGLADSSKWAGFFDTHGAPIAVTYSGATANVVPLPATAWLLLSGLAPLLRVGRRR